MRPVTLVDGLTVLGNVNLASDFPGEPPVLQWRGKLFVSTSSRPSPAGYESYAMQPVLSLRDDDVSPPDVAPTNTP